MAHAPPPHVERSVVSRTRFHIALPTSTCTGAGGRPSTGSEGWSSPHGEPYRPLGRPELDLKFSPQLVYGVSPMLQNAHRVRALETEKDKELREPSPCSTPGTPLATLVEQFVAPLRSRQRSLDERQAKLAHRLQANVSGFSPAKVRGLHRGKPQAQELEERTTSTDNSLQLLREAIEQGASRLRATRNGTHFLQNLPPSDLDGLEPLYKRYLSARVQTPESVVSSGGGVKSPRVVPGPTTANGDLSLGSSESDDDQGTWYLPYTTRQLQRSPHRRLPSLGEFRRARDDKQPSRPPRAQINSKTSPHRKRTSSTRSSHASVVSTRGSMIPMFGALNSLGEKKGENDTFESSAVFPSFATNKVASSPFTTASQSPPSSVAPLHSVEKLQAAVDALEVAKSQKSARLATALEMLEQDRRECLSGKFRSLHVQCDAAEDLRRMRELSERQRGQRVLAVVTNTADWYPELLRRLHVQESANVSSTGATNSHNIRLAGPHTAELFIVQAVRHFTNIGCEFRPPQLFQVMSFLHHDDLELLQVQKLLTFLRNALCVNFEEWSSFFTAHGLSEPSGDFVDG